MDSSWGLQRIANLRSEIFEKNAEIARLRQSLHKARELIEVLIDSPEFKNDALDYYVQYIGFGDYDAARKWLEENGDG